MSKKIVLSIIFLTAILFSFNYVFAENMAQDAANTVNGSIDKTQNTMNDAGNAVKDAGNSAMNAVNDVVNGTMNTVNDITKDRNTDTSHHNTSNYNTDNNMTSSANNGNYTATRTAAEGATLLGMTASTWTWLIMGIVGISIITLIWYYSMQTADHGFDDE